MKSRGVNGAVQPYRGTTLEGDAVGEKSDIAIEYNKTVKDGLAWKICGFSTLLAIPLGAMIIVLELIRNFVNPPFLNGFFENIFPTIEIISLAFVACWSVLIMTMGQILDNEERSG